MANYVALADGSECLRVRCAQPFKTLSEKRVRSWFSGQNTVCKGSVGLCLCTAMVKRADMAATTCLEARW